jgi:hypothetical protein
MLTEVRHRSAKGEMVGNYFLWRPIARLCRVRRAAGMRCLVHVGGELIGGLRGDIQKVPQSQS